MLTILIIIVLVIALAMLLFFRRVKNVSQSQSSRLITGGGSTSFALSNVPELVKQVKAYMNEHISFAELTQSEELALTNLAQKINSDFTPIHVKAIRTMELPMLRAKAVNRLKSKYKQYNADCAKCSPDVKSVLNLSNKYKLPPCVVEVKLDKEVKSEIDKLDLTSSYNAMITRERADRYEKDVENYLREIGVEFKTENDLRRENSKLTPDFLLTKPVNVEKLFGNKLKYYLGPDKEISWIDAKNYPMFDLKLTREKLISQAKKYNAAFGPGAYVFSKGVMSKQDMITVPEATLVDGTSIYSAE